MPASPSPLLAFVALAALTGCGGDPDEVTDHPTTPTRPDTTAPPTLTATARVDTLSQATVSVRLTTAASTAAACVRRDEPEEVHLLEAPASLQAEFRFAGLLAATDYDCTVAPISPAGEPVRVSLRTPDPPDELASADVTQDPTLLPTGGYTVMTVRPECRSERTDYIAVLDHQGNNRWRYDLPPTLNIGVEVASDGPDRFLVGGGQHTDGVPVVVDVRDGEQWRLAFPGSEDTVFHHDVNRIDDGRVLSVEDDVGLDWAAFHLRLSDESGATSWSWSAASVPDWLPPGDSEHDDPHHLNWADVVETDDGLVAYASLCFAQLVVAIDVATGAPLWRFGAGGDFTLVDELGAPLPDDEFPQCQHGLQTDGRHLLVYDNGLDRGHTRAVEYELDTERRIARRTWQWTDEGFWEKYHGGTDWLDPEHRRVLIAEGNNDCGGTSSRHSQVVELDREGDREVHRLVLRDLADWIYRAHRVDGCDLFADVRLCPELSDRFEVLRPALDL